MRQEQLIRRTEQNVFQVLGALVLWTELVHIHNALDLNGNVREDYLIRTPF